MYQSGQASHLEVFTPNREYMLAHLPVTTAGTILSLRRDPPCYRKAVVTDIGTKEEIVGTTCPESDSANYPLLVTQTISGFVNRPQRLVFSLAAGTPVRLSQVKSSSYEDSPFTGGWEVRAADGFASSPHIALSTSIAPDKVRVTYYTHDAVPFAEE